MLILKTSRGWRSWPLSIGWIDGLLGFGPWGDWESLGAHAPSSGLFIEGNLKAHALSLRERILFLAFWFFFFKEKHKQEIQTNIPMMSLQSKPKQHVPKNSNGQT